MLDAEMVEVVHSERLPSVLRREKHATRARSRTAALLGASRSVVQRPERYTAKHLGAVAGPKGVTAKDEAVLLDTEPVVLQGVARSA
jgi:hypothetical protein